MPQNKREFLCLLGEMAVEADEAYKFSSGKMEELFSRENRTILTAQEKWSLDNQLTDIQENELRYMHLASNDQKQALLAGIQSLGPLQAGKEFFFSITNDELDSITQDPEVRSKLLLLAKESVEDVHDLKLRSNQDLKEQFKHEFKGHVEALEKERRIKLHSLLHEASEQLTAYVPGSKISPSIETQLDLDNSVKCLGVKASVEELAQILQSALPPNNPNPEKAREVWTQYGADLPKILVKAQLLNHAISENYPDCGLKKDIQGVNNAPSQADQLSLIKADKTYAWLKIVNQFSKQAAAADPQGVFGISQLAEQLVTERNVLLKEELSAEERGDLKAQIQLACKGGSTERLDMLKSLYTAVETAAIQKKDGFVSLTDAQKEMRQAAQAGASIEVEKKKKAI